MRAADLSEITTIYWLSVGFAIHFAAVIIIIAICQLFGVLISNLRKYLYYLFDILIRKFIVTIRIQ